MKVKEYEFSGNVVRVFDELGDEYVFPDNTFSSVAQLEVKVSQLAAKKGKPLVNKKDKLIKDFADNGITLKVKPVEPVEESEVVIK